MSGMFSWLRGAFRLNGSSGWRLLIASALLGSLVFGTGMLHAQNEVEENSESVTEASAEQSGSVNEQTAGEAALETIPDATEWLEKYVFPQAMQGVHFLLKDYQWYCLIAVIFLGFFADLVTRQS